MSHVPSLDAQGKRWYGHNHSRKPEDLKRCAMQISRVVGNWPEYHQCNRARGHGPDGVYCKQHDPAAVQARNAILDERHRQKNEQVNRPFAQRKAYEDALEQIANGHNDPSALARETLNKMRGF